MNVWLKVMRARLEYSLFAFIDSRSDDRISDNIRIAINLGTTLPTRLWLSAFSVFVGAQLQMGSPSMFSHVGYQVFFKMVPPVWWTTALVSSGLLMFWRVMTPRASPIWAWISNTLTLTIWTIVVVSRIGAMGFEALVSSTSVIWIMSIWVMMRTETTRRDRETA